MEEFPPGMPFTCQLTAGFEAFRTVAVNWTLAPADICAEGGERLTVTTGVGWTLALLFDEVPPPPLQEICWVMAMSATHLAIARSSERGDLRTRE
jgi:hypothetical protein